ncbi:DNA repair protein [Corynespora cassiicola Philippines]|uniref:DNA repair protein REV1 n=1 Tax=Corynespora cassiicola Philippines TaxID=1448308 RepID=A0A2T2N7D3_CORCC|nr:DNA repair protein [Corynespora cassiicola Philippines]
MGSRLERNSSAVRKRIANHSFDNEDGDEYRGSEFGGFGDYFRRKKVKLQNLDADIRARSDKPQIFKGVVVHVNGYTQPSLSQLHVLIVQHGGGFMQYLDGKTTVTHIVASALTPRKTVEYRNYRVVKPEWVIDSIAAGKLLAWNKYSVIDEGDNQKVLSFDQGKMRSRANIRARGYLDEPNRNWYTGQPSSNLTDGSSSALTPKSAMRSRFSKQVPSAPGDEIEEEVPPVDVQCKPSPPKNDSTSIGQVPKRPLTAEEHNAILLQDPKVRKSTVVDPNFLEQYYRESRLHHLSSWKAGLKTRLQAMASEKSVHQGPRHNRTAGARRYILHVDFDSFFAAVSLKKYPQFKDKPAVVAHGSGGGSEIASCNYPAREFGIKNGMWMKQAHELCPTLKVLPYDFPAYEEASQLFYEAILATEGHVQSVSVDEALVDVSGTFTTDGPVTQEQAKVDQIAHALRDEVKAKTGCNVSIGIGSNILLAKLALKKAKPAGQYHILPEDVPIFLGGLRVEDLPGVASAIQSKLGEVGIEFVRDVRESSKAQLIRILGPKTGEKLWNYARGIDRQEIGEQVVRRSVSAEINWGVRFENQRQAEELVSSLCGELHTRLIREMVKGSMLTMKIMRRSPYAPLDPPKHLGHGECDTYNKSLGLGVATNSKEVLTREGLAILRCFGFSPGDIRGVGVQMTKLEPMKSPSDGNVESSQRRLPFAPLKAQSAHGYGDGDLGTIGSRTPVESKVVDGEDHVFFGPEELNCSTPSRRPLNMLGTQFILPPAYDPKVLYALPEQMRDKLLRQGQLASNSGLDAQSLSSEAGTEYDRQVPEDCAANAMLPKDVTTTPALSFYGDCRNRLETFPQSTRRNKIIEIPTKKPIVIAAKRGRGRPSKYAQLAAAALVGAKSKDGRTLTQANFITRRKTLADCAQESSEFTGQLDESLPASPVSNTGRYYQDGMDEVDEDTEFVAVDMKDGVDDMSNMNVMYDMDDMVGRDDIYNMNDMYDMDDMYSMKDIYSIDDTDCSNQLQNVEDMGDMYDTIGTRNGDKVDDETATDYSVDDEFGHSDDVDSLAFEETSDEFSETGEGGGRVVQNFLTEDEPEEIERGEEGGGGGEEEEEEEEQQEEGDDDEEEQREIAADRADSSTANLTSDTHETMQDRDIFHKSIRDWMRGNADGELDADEVQALDAYLEGLVIQERDLGKAVEIIKCMDWTMDSIGGNEASEGMRLARSRWEGTVRRLKKTVQAAAKSRRLGTLRM